MGHEYTRIFIIAGISISDAIRVPRKTHERWEQLNERYGDAVRLILGQRNILETIKDIVLEAGCHNWRDIKGV